MLDPTPPYVKLVAAGREDRALAEEQPERSDRCRDRRGSLPLRWVLAPPACSGLKAINLGVWGRAPREHRRPSGHMSLSSAFERSATRHKLAAVSHQRSAVRHQPLAFDLPPLSFLLPPSSFILHPSDAAASRGGGGLRRRRRSRGRGCRPGRGRGSRPGWPGEPG